MLVIKSGECNYGFATQVIFETTRKIALASKQAHFKRVFKHHDAVAQFFISFATWMYMYLNLQLSIIYIKLKIKVDICKE